MAVGFGFICLVILYDFLLCSYSPNASDMVWTGDLMYVMS